MEKNDNSNLIYNKKDGAIVMKKIKKISYPSKYKELLEKYGEERGNDEYYKFIRGSSLEKYVLKYGENADQYWKNYIEKQKNSGVSLHKMILKYGEDGGRKKYENWKKTTKQDLKGFIERYGEDDGKKKYEVFRSKSLDSLKKVDRKNVKNQRTIKYWVDLGYNIDGAKIKVSEIQNTSSLTSFIKKYGEEEGQKRYIEVNKFKSQTIENMIRLYGEDIGREKYEEYILRLKYAKSIEYYIEKYGNIEGVEIYNQIQKKKICNFDKMYSIIGVEFCENVVSKIKEDFNKIYYGDTEYKFFVWEDEFKIIMVDFYIKDINMIIEFYGDYWHRNPKFYNNDDDVFIQNKNSKRIDKLKQKYNSNILIVWENDYRNNKTETINFVVNEIYKIKNNKK